MNAEVYEKELNEKIGKIFIDLLSSNGLLHERDLRNIKIRADYKEMINNGANKGEARKILSERFYFTTRGQKYLLSEEAIKKIVYPDKRDE
ncbi:MAG: hypothetical protein HYS25_13730 [Ignavibacteriales bacterium]|nr:hypothetical protein [Ignavibacteriales bacterium]